MTRRSAIFADQDAGIIHRLGILATDIRGSLTGGGFAPFTGMAPALPQLLGGNSAIAHRLYRGVFRFAGHRVECQPTQIFEARSPSAGWSDELLSFEWLSHLEAPGLALYKAFARKLTQGWAARRRRTSLDVSCRRLMSLSRFAGFLLAGGGADFESKFLHLVSREARILARLRPCGAPASLRQSIALLTAGLAFRGGGSLRSDALARAASLIDSVILPDGGPADRSPKTLLHLLSDLAPLRAAMEAQRIAIPDSLNAAMERAIPMLRMLSHGDGGLAVFHGVERISEAIVQAILDHDAVQGRPLSHAMHSGYCRVSQEQSLIIADCGTPGICDSALAFEFSHGAQRMVVSCGAPVNASPEWLAAARSAAAHSTLHLEDGQCRGEPTKDVALVETPHGTFVKASTASRRLSHAREFFLACNGADFRGEDRVETLQPDLPPANFTIRFHLHPSVKASGNRKGAAIILLLPSKEAWRFSARGGALSLEDSIYLAGSGPRNSQQIVIRGIAGTTSRINWAFRKIERQARNTDAQGVSPPFPF